MISYDFPLIDTIDDVLPAIKDRPEFIVAEREDFDVINYNVVMADTFPPVIIPNPDTTSDQKFIRDENAAMRRECRGLMFDKSGKLISRPYHKFFNINEREETGQSEIDLGMEHLVFDKLDGSMVRPLYIEKLDSFRWTTKMGLSDVALNAEIFAASNSQYSLMARELFNHGYTPIFEWVSPKNQIVVRYPDDNLVLTAIRNTKTGSYVSIDNMQYYAKLYRIPVVKTYEQIGDIVRFIQTVKQEKGNEGYILRFNNGHMVKIKTEQYILMHHSKEIVDSERKVVLAIVDENIDDLRSALVENDRLRVNEMEKNFWNDYRLWYEHIVDTFDEIEPIVKGDKKEFAIKYAARYDSTEKGILFSLFAGKDLNTVLLNLIRSSLSTDTKYQTFKSYMLSKRTK